MCHIAMMSILQSSKCSRKSLAMSSPFVIWGVGFKQNSSSLTVKSKYLTLTTKCGIRLFLWVCECSTRIIFFLSISLWRLSHRVDDWSINPVRAGQINSMDGESKHTLRPSSMNHWILISLRLVVCYSICAQSLHVTNNRIVGYMYSNGTDNEHSSSKLGNQYVATDVVIVAGHDK